MTEPTPKSKDKRQFIDTIAVRLFSLLKSVIFAIILLAIIFIFIKIYTPQEGVIILPFEIKNENLSGIAISDQITSELLQIQKIHSRKNEAEILSKSQTIIEAEFSPDLSSRGVIPKTETMEFSMANTGSITTSFGSLDPGKLIIAFKNICPGSKSDNTIRGSLQRYGSNIALVAVLEGDNVQSWIARQPVDENNEEQLHQMILNLTFMIAHDLPKSNVSAKTWEGLKYYTEALDSYNEYKTTGDIDKIYQATNYSLKAMSFEKGYSNPYDLLQILEMESIKIKKESNAIEICNRTIELDSSSEFGWQNKALVLYLLNRQDEAIQAYDTAISINPNSASAWNGKGILLSNLSKYDEAIEAYDQAIRINPNYATAWNNKGFAFHVQGKYDDAISCYNKAIRLDSDYAKAWNNKGLALYNLGEYNKAIIAYNKAISINPNYFDAWNNKGLALIAQGKYDEAIKAYDEAIKVNPRNAIPWHSKGWALYNQGEYDKAIIAYNKSISINPNYFAAWNNKGLALIAQGKYDEAIEAYDEAIKINPRNAIPWDNKGYALKALGKTTEADAAFSTANELRFNTQ